MTKSTTTAAIIQLSKNNRSKQENDSSKSK